MSRFPAVNRLRIVVLGYMVRGPLGGMVWSNLQFVAGLARLGHDVYFIEDSDDYPSCYNPELGVTERDPAYGLAFTDRALKEIGLSDHWSYFDAHSGQWLGGCAAKAVAICESADLVLNLCGMNPLRPWLAGAPLRVLVDEDPGFTQVRHLTDPKARERADQHNVFLTFAVNVGRAECQLPDDGYPWQPTRQPVVLEFVCSELPRPGGSFTTVMQWNSYPAVVYGGVRYGLKADSFSPYMDLPMRVREALELAVTGTSTPKEALTACGWRIVDGVKTTTTPGDYRRYIAGSKAEFSVAKHGYVVSESGWFSERSVAYLATGRPAVLQDTGFTAWLECGAGIVPFSDPDQACAAIEEISARYDFHCRSAREIAEAYFASDRVLNALLDDCFSAPSPSASPRDTSVESVRARPTGHRPSKL